MRMAERTIVLTDLTEDQAAAIDEKASKYAEKIEEYDIRNNPYAEGQKQVPSTTEHKQKVQQVVSKPATRKQETTADKIKKAFFGEEVTNVKDYMIFDIAIPALRSTISDMLCGGIQAVFHRLFASGRMAVPFGQQFYLRERDGRFSSCVLVQCHRHQAETTDQGVL
jgi:hypothetical protein